MGQVHGQQRVPGLQAGEIDGHVVAKVFAREIFKEEPAEKIKSPCRQSFRILIAKARPAKPSAIITSVFQSSSTMSREQTYAAMAPPTTTLSVSSVLFRGRSASGTGRNLCTLSVYWAGRIEVTLIRLARTKQRCHSAMLPIQFRSNIRAKITFRKSAPLATKQSKL